MYKCTHSSIYYDDEKNFYECLDCGAKLIVKEEVKDE